jgi:hypothetical protein
MAVHPFDPSRTRSWLCAAAHALLIALAACTTTVESSTAYTGSASAQSINLGGYTTEPSGWVYPQVLTSLGVGAKDAGATWFSLGAFRASGTAIASGGRNYYAWNGNLTNFTNTTWPSGGVARVRVLYQVGTSTTTGFTFDDLGCLLQDPSLDFEQRAIACQSHDSAYLHLVDKDPVHSSTRPYISLRETPVVRFQGQVVVDPANDYYAVVDPNSTRTTLAAWQSVNGFNGSGGSLPGYQPVVTTTYFNKGDLELGRHMNCVKKTNSAALACYVSNYGDAAAPGGPGPGNNPTVALAAAVSHGAIGLVATVAMEYRPAATSNRVTFYAFNNLGVRANAAVLDREGLKSLPGACLSCHGGRFNSGTDSVNGAHFLPFDVDNFSYSTAANYTLAAQQDAFRALNNLVLGAGPTPAITELVNGWYGSNLGSAGPDQDTEFVPTGWSGQEVVYQEAVKPYCRGCHVALDDAAAAPQIFDMNTYSEFNALRFSAMTRMCELYDMPHSQVTRTNFWQSPARGHLIGEFNLPTACP